jgi:hypothetical protein
MGSGVTGVRPAHSRLPCLMPEFWAAAGATTCTAFPRPPLHTAAGLVQLGSELSQNAKITRYFSGPPCSRPFVQEAGQVPVNARAKDHTRCSRVILSCIVHSAIAIERRFSESCGFCCVGPRRHGAGLQHSFVELARWHPQRPNLAQLSTKTGASRRWHACPGNISATISKLCTARCQMSCSP